MKNNNLIEEKIKQSLLSLMKEESFEKITITKITNNISINRGTFYLHFFDKYDLLEKIENDIFGDVLATLDSSFHLVNINNIRNSQQSEVENILFLIYFAVEKHLDELKILLSRNGSLSTSYKLNNFFAENVRKNIGEIINHQETLIPKEYIFAVAASVHYSIIMKWLNKDHRESAKELAQISGNIVFPIIKQIIQKKDI